MGKGSGEEVHPVEREVLVAFCGLGVTQLQRSLLGVSGRADKVATKSTPLWPGTHSSKAGPPRRYRPITSPGARSSIAVCQSEQTACTGSGHSGALDMA